MPRGLLYALLVVLYLLHNDFWFWRQPRELFGLPAGFVYHVSFCLVASALMFVAIVGFMPLFPQSYRQTKASGRITQLNHLVARQAERLRSIDFEDPLLSAGTHPDQQADSKGAGTDWAALLVAAALAALAALPAAFPSTPIAAALLAAFLRSAAGSCGLPS